MNCVWSWDWTGQVTGATHYHQFQEVWGLGERFQEAHSDETHVLKGLIFLQMRKHLNTQQIHSLTH